MYSMMAFYRNKAQPIVTSYIMTFIPKTTPEEYHALEISKKEWLQRRDVARLYYCCRAIEDVLTHQQRYSAAEAHDLVAHRLRRIYAIAGKYTKIDLPLNECRILGFTLTLGDEDIASRHKTICKVLPALLPHFLPLHEKPMKLKVNKILVKTFVDFTLEAVSEALMSGMMSAGLTQLQRRYLSEGTTHESMQSPIVKLTSKAQLPTHMRRPAQPVAA